MGAFAFTGSAYLTNSSFLRSALASLFLAGTSLTTGSGSTFLAGTFPLLSSSFLTYGAGSSFKDFTTLAFEADFVAGFTGAFVVFY